MLIATDPRYRAAYAVRDPARGRTCARWARSTRPARGYAELLLDLIRENRLEQFDRLSGAAPAAAAWSNAATHQALGG